MDNKSQNIIASIADKLFLPVDVDYKNYFATPLRILVLVYFLYSCAIALPPVIEIVKAGSYQLPLISLVLNDPDFWQVWLPYVNFILEILFFLMIGGSVFSEWVVAHSKKIIDKYGKAVESARKNDIVDVKDELTQRIKEYYSLLEGINITNSLPRLYALYKTSRSVIGVLMSDVAKVNAKFLSTKLAVSFPGGFYGLFAFVLFALLVQVKIAQFYLPSNG